MENIIGIEDVILVIPYIALFVFALIPLTVKVLNNNQEQRPYATLLQAVMGLSIAGAFFLLQANDAVVSAFDTSLIFDGVNRWLSLLMVILAGLALFVSVDNINTKGSQYSEHTFFVLISLTGMLILSASSDLIITFIGVEIMSLALYVLVAISREQVLAKEAAFKYFILGSLASAIMLYGIALIYGSAGTTYLPDIGKLSSDLLQSDIVYNIGGVLVLIGLLFKVSIFPFHAWTPDVYQGAPTPVTAFMSTGVKIATFSFLIRIFAEGIYRDNAFVFELLQWLCVITILVGNIGAIIQSSLKRMLAYSSVAHSGYLLVGILVLSVNPKDGLAVAAIMFYLFSYAVANLASFGFIGLMEKHEDKEVFVEDMSGIAKKHPVMSLIFTVLMLSLAGIPPLIGFFGKFYLFSAAIQYSLYWVAVWGVIGSVVSVYYYLRPVIHMYMKEGESSDYFGRHDLTYIALSLCLFVVLVLGVFSSNLLSSIQISL